MFGGACRSLTGCAVAVILAAVTATPAMACRVSGALPSGSLADLDRMLVADSEVVLIGSVENLDGDRAEIRNEATVRGPAPDFVTIEDFVTVRCFYPPSPWALSDLEVGTRVVLFGRHGADSFLPGELVRLDTPRGQRVMLLLERASH